MYYGTSKVSHEKETYRFLFDHRVEIVVELTVDKHRDREYFKHILKQLHLDLPRILSFFRFNTFSNYSLDKRLLPVLREESD